VSERRDEIVAIARKLFAEQGYVSTSMRDIADATGLLPGSLYTHFKSKAKLVEEIVAVFYRDLLAAQQEASSFAGTGADRFRLMIRATYRVCDTYPEELTILHYDWKELSTLDEIAEVREISVRTLATWRKVIKGGIADGTLRSTMSPELVSRITTGAIHSMLDPVRYRDHPASKKTNPVEQLEEMLLDGLLSRPTRVGSSSRTAVRRT
jgi:TetR/AcrR family transcriptional regulator, cholesterol catabolism regulator